MMLGEPRTVVFTINAQNDNFCAADSGTGSRTSCTSTRGLA
jgi:hypothetical protein